MRRFLRVLAAAAVLTLPAAAMAQGVCGANSLGAASAPITTFPYTIGAADMCTTKVFSTAVGSGVIAIPAPGTVGQFTPNFPVWLMNVGPQILTLTPSAPATGGSAPTINAKSTQPLTPQQGGMLAVGADGNWYFTP